MAWNPAVQPGSAEGSVPRWRPWDEWRIASPVSEQPHLSAMDDWRPWEEGLSALAAHDCCAAADAFYVGTRLTLDDLWDASPSHPVAEAVKRVASLAAAVLHAHNDLAGAVDLLEFGYERGRRDAELLMPYVTLLLDRDEAEAARRLLDEALRREPGNVDYAALRRRCEARLRRACRGPRPRMAGAGARRLQAATR